MTSPAPAVAAPEQPVGPRVDVLLAMIDRMLEWEEEVRQGKAVITVQPAPFPQKQNNPQFLAEAR